ncbi:MAG: type II secretion system F family protein [Phycisphaeraceae bacterium]|nr:type II secretion system F family protein [Phycisphaeraceae bacterium]
MTVWRYEAIPLDRSSGATVSGVMPAAARSDARAALRRVGLQALVIEPLGDKGLAGALRRGLRWAHGSATGVAMARVARARRTAARAELADSIATMLDAGMTLAEALETAGRATRDRSMRVMLVAMGQEIASGGGLGNAMRAHEMWFDEAEHALIEAGHTSGELARAWRTIGERLERRAQTIGRLVGVAAYPALVACVSVVVVGFLGTRTLPELVKILDDAGVATPRLTMWVMMVGGFVAKWGWLAAIAMCVVGVIVGRGVAARWPGTVARLRPRVIVALKVARASRTVADLLEAGVPLADALRVAAPSSGRSLGAALRAAATGIQRGEDLASAFRDARWFDAEAKRVLALAQATGDLAPALARMADRWERRAQRAIDGLARAAEPVLILSLAAVVGILVMAAVLPLIKLQEVL